MSTPTLVRCSKSGTFFLISMFVRHVLGCVSEHTLPHDPSLRRAWWCARTENRHTSCLCSLAEARSNRPAARSRLSGFGLTANVGGTSFNGPRFCCYLKPATEERKCCGLVKRRRTPLNRRSSLQVRFWKRGLSRAGRPEARRASLPLGETRPAKGRGRSTRLDRGGGVYA